MNQVNAGLSNMTSGYQQLNQEQLRGTQVTNQATGALDGYAGSLAFASGSQDAMNGSIPFASGGT